MNGPPNGNWLLCMNCKNLQDDCGIMTCRGYEHDEGIKDISRRRLK